MKYRLHISLLMLICLLCGGCQTAPKTKPIAELTEADQLEMYKYGPIDKPREKEVDWMVVLETTGALILCLPVFAVEALARGGNQMSVGK